ncbi:MAG: LamG domain-containing protein [Gammaproteobacteria bacterium]|nr:LamG domain-containing protein [Gammaproteobacteria bacterium]
MSDYIKLQILSNHSDGSTTIEDTSPLGQTITVNGDTHHETDQAYHGSSSIYLDGDGDTLVIPDHADLDFGAAEYTVDFFLYPVSSTGDEEVIRKYSSGDGFFCIWSTNGSVGFHHIYGGGGSYYDIDSGAGTVPANQWSRVTVTRDGDDNLCIYINGVQKDATPAPTAMAANSADVTVGSIGTAFYIDSLHIYKGEAVWSGEDDFLYGDIEALIPSMQGSMVVGSHLAATIPSMTGEILGGAKLAATIPMMTGEMGAVAQYMAMDATIPMMTGEMFGGAKLTATIPSMTGAITGQVGRTLQIDGQVPMMTGVMTGSAEQVHNLAATIPMMTGSMSIIKGVNGSFAATIPSMTGEITASRGNAFAATIPMMIGEITIDETVDYGITRHVRGEIR